MTEASSLGGDIAKRTLLHTNTETILGQDLKNQPEHIYPNIAFNKVMT